jgi:hypothetical protein
MAFLVQAVSVSGKLRVVHGMTQRNGLGIVEAGGSEGAYKLVQAVAFGSGVVFKQAAAIEQAKQRLERTGVGHGWLV